MSFSAYEYGHITTYDYTPPLNAKLFKRNKYAIRVKREDFGDFRKWCKLNGMENLMFYAEDVNGFIYLKETGQVITNHVNTGCPSTPIIYNWEDMVTPDTIKGITIRYGEEV